MRIILKEIESLYSFYLKYSKLILIHDMTRINYMSKLKIIFVVIYILIYYIKYFLYIITTLKISL